MKSLKLCLKSLLVLVVVLLSLLMVACSDSDTVTKIAIKNNKNLKVNETCTLAIETEPAGMNVSVNWSTNDPTVASVSESGVVTALKAGTVVITAKYAKDEKIRSSVTITVTGEGQADQSGDDPIQGDDTKVKTGVDVKVENADIANYLQGGKLYVTTFGQADKAYMVSIVEDAIGSSGITVTNNNVLKASDVEAGSVVIAVVGFTSKGISGDITQTGEVNRAKDFSDRDDITLIICQLDGKNRRGDSSDPIIEEAVRGAKVVMIFDDGDPSSLGANYDGKYTTLCQGKRFFSFSDEYNMTDFIAVMIGAK